jgi:hypothetical protein
MGYQLTDEQTRRVAEGVFKSLYWDEFTGDRDRSPYEPYTVEECRARAEDRLDWIHSHCKDGFGELESFANFFYAAADYDRVTEICNEMLKQNWKWG